MRVLIVDDTVLYRKILQDVLSAIPDVEVVATAPNGKIALSKIDRFRPDLMTLDVEMPEMDGIETLRHLKQKAHRPAVLMVSSLTQHDAEVTLQALNLGAFDFIAKPDGGSFAQNIEMLTEQLVPKIQALIRKNLHRTSNFQRLQSGMTPLTAAPVTRPRIVAIGVSTGGPKALADVIPKLPADLPVPLVVVQHMPPLFTRALANSLNNKSQLTVVEAEHGMALQSGTVYVAPGGKQMKLNTNSIHPKIQLTDDPPENHCRPSVDYLFRSVNEIYGSKALAVIMTGMGRDGTEGLRLLKQSGAYNLAQDEATSVIYGMPMEAVRAGVVDEVLPLNRLAERIDKIVKG